jgi:HlyD family secretion protein
LPAGFLPPTLQPVTTVEVGTGVPGSCRPSWRITTPTVRQGQVVAKLDPSSDDAIARGSAALAQARADILGVDAAVADAQTKFTRAEALSASQLIPQSDLDAARIALEETNAGRREGEASVVEATAAVAQASVNVEHTIIRSPIDGIVIERNVDVGQTLAASIQAPVLFRIAADLRRMQVQVDIDEADVGGLTAGRPATSRSNLSR